MCECVIADNNCFIFNYVKVQKSVDLDGDNLHEISTGIRDDGH